MRELLVGTYWPTLFLGASSRSRGLEGRGGDIRPGSRARASGGHPCADAQQLLGLPRNPGLLTGCDGGIMVSGGHTVLSRIPQQCFDPGRHPVCPRELRATLGCAGHTMANTMRSSPYTCQIPGVMVALHNGLAGDIDVPASA